MYYNDIGVEVMDLGFFIKTRRLELGLTQEKLGSMIGKNKQLISRLEKGDIKSLKQDYIQPLAEALQVPILDLFNGIDYDMGISYEPKIIKKEITREEFKQELESLLSRTDIDDEKKEYIKKTIEMMCKDE